METHRVDEFLSLGELCLRVVRESNTFFVNDATQRTILNQLPEELRWTIFSYFLACSVLTQFRSHADVSFVNDDIISTFFPTNKVDVNFGELIRISDASLATVADRIGERLTALHLNGCVSITDVGITVIASSCPNLKQLNISGCPLVGSKSIEVLQTKCPLLQELDVSDCNLIDDEVLYSITMMPNLAILNLADCNRLRFDISPTNSPRASYWATLEKKSMKSLCLRSILSLNDLALLRLVRMFPELRILDVSFSSGRITDRGVEAVALSAAASFLFSLNLWGAKITDMAINHLAGTCTNLKTLTVSDCPSLTETSILLLISKMKALKTLTMWGCTGISAVSIQLFLRYFTDLNSLGLNYCSQMLDYSLKGLSSSMSLRNIELEGCENITDEGIKDLGNEYISSLNFRGCTNLSPAAVSAVVERCPNISSLTLCRLPFSNGDFQSILVSAKQLTRLSLAVGATLTDGTLASLLDSGAAEHLQVLKLDNCVSLTDKIFQRIWVECSKLTDLSVNFCQQLSNAALEFTLPRKSRGCLQLKRLSLAGCLGIHSKAVCALLERCPKLTHLMVTLIADSDDVLLSRVGKYCPSLESLSAGRTDKITSTGLRHIAQGCIAVKQLDLSGCDSLTDSALTQIAKLGKTLRTLDISNCPYVSSTAILEMLVHARDLQTLAIKANDQRHHLPKGFFDELANLRPLLRVVKNY